MTTIEVDVVEVVEGVDEVDRLTKVVVIHQHLETATGIVEILVLMAFEVDGTSSSGLDSIVTVTGTGLD